MNQFDLQFILPEILLIGSAMTVLMIGVMTAQKKILGLFALLGVVLALTFLTDTFAMTGTFFSGMLVNDGLTMFFRTISLIIAGIVILLSMAYRQLDDEEKGEYYFFILVVTLSMMLASATRNLMMIYIALEAISLLSYILAGYLKRDVFSSEAGLKYFLFGAFSTGVTLYGISLVYGLFGTLDLSVISHLLTTQGVYQPALLVSFLLVLAGFGFKCSLAPFHMWTPDVYQGAPTPIAAFFSVGPKAIGFAFLLRVFIDVFPSAGVPWTFVFTLLAIVTMTLGNLAAIRQDNIKRLLAYSTIAQAGYMLIGLTTGTMEGVQAVLFYLFIYALMNLGAFGAVIAVSSSIGSDLIKDYAGLYQRAPFLAVVLAVSFLSLAGIPPLAGFLAKFFVFAAAVEQGLFGLVIIAALNSVAALYYYARIIKAAFLSEPEQNFAIVSSKAAMLTLGLILLAILILGVWPHPVINWISQLR